VGLRLGYKGIQMPSWDGRLFNLKNAAESTTYCEEVKGTLAQHGLQITELSTHLQGQLVAVHPAYDAGFDGFAAPEVRGNPLARQKWAVQQMLYAAKASANLGLTAHASFSGALAWPYLYSWPPRPPGLIEEAFDELAKRWRPIPRRVRRCRCRRLLRDPPGRGSARRRDLRDVSRARRQP
jgi:sugar phosphate isomerase/epimerase